MQHVLVHIDQGLGPIGAWSYRRGVLTHFYPESLEPAISARARKLMAARGDDTTVVEWMDLVAGSDPTLLDEFATFDINEAVTLPAILADFRRSWAASD